MPDLSILMPVYNEAATVEPAVEAALAADVGVDSRELLLIDDGSTDGSAELLAGLAERDEVRLISHERNRGKGAALRSGVAEATGRWSTVMDADLEYDPAEIKRLMEPLLSGTANVVYGSRGFESHSAYSFWYVMGNKTMTLAANVLYDCWLSDIMTCHKAMATDLWRSLPLKEDGFACEPEITARLLRRGERIFEVPVSYHARSREAGKKLTALDGLRVMRTLLRCRLTSPREPLGAHHRPGPS